MANIADFKAQMTGGGARANQFKIFLSFPSFVTALSSSDLTSVNKAASILCKATTLPASTLENVPVMYRGRAVNFAGERTFTPWQIEVYNDENFAVHTALTNWSTGIQSLSTTTGTTNPKDYQCDLEVVQLGRDGRALKTYRIHDAYPLEIGEIALDYETGNAIETFTCQFQYNYYTILNQPSYVNNDKEEPSSITIPGVETSIA